MLTHVSRKDILHEREYIIVRLYYQLEFLHNMHPHHSLYALFQALAHVVHKITSNVSED